MPRIINIIVGGLFVFFVVAVFFLVDYLGYSIIPKPRKIQWLGSIAYGQKIPGGYADMGSTIGTIDGHYEIGLRGDNVIVWRKAGEKK